jgi:L-ornithine N5-oxygenase
MAEYSSLTDLDLLVDHGEFGDQLGGQPEGGLVVGRDYRLAMTGDAQCGIYLQGATEHTYGHSSNAAVHHAVPWVRLCAP